MPRTTLVKNGFWMSGMTTPMVLVARARRFRAMWLGRYSSSLTASNTRWASSPLTNLAPESTRETVAADTCACSATS